MIIAPQEIEQTYKVNEHHAIYPVGLVLYKLTSGIVVNQEYQLIPLEYFELDGLTLIFEAENEKISENQLRQQNGE